MAAGGRLEKNEYFEKRIEKAYLCKESSNPLHVMATM